MAGRKSRAAVNRLSFPVFWQPLRQRQTQSIGRPIKEAVDELRECGCIMSSTRVLITIDQFEHLLDFDMHLKSRHFGLLRDVIDEAIHLREPTVCYRVGTRPHAWRHRRSERLRDYVEIDLDELLRRKEHSRSALFPVLAKDVFRRRLRCFGYSEIAGAPDPLKAVFGSSPSAEERIQRMAPGANWARSLHLPPTIPKATRDALQELAKTRPLSAKLGGAWVQQALATANLRRDPTGALLKIHSLPWEQSAKRWWKKERIAIAVLQLAAHSRQRVPMAGKKDIVDLSGGNILVFGSVCQHVWGCWLRSTSIGDANNGDAFPIDPVLQDEGVRKASTEWHKKISEEAWVGDTLSQFIDVLGNYLHTQLIDDKAMSYPGGNGISLADKDLKALPDVCQILLDGTDRGFLLQRRHTPKYRPRGPSTKWYLHPVLAPYFELTIGHTKEPRYIRADVARKWMQQAGLLPMADVSEVATNMSQPQAFDTRQKRLPGFEDDE